MRVSDINKELNKHNTFASPSDYLSTRDVSVLVWAVKKLRQFMSSSKLMRATVLGESVPGTLALTDEDLAIWVSNKMISAFDMSFLFLMQ